MANISFATLFPVSPRDLNTVPGASTSGAQSAPEIVALDGGQFFLAYRSVTGAPIQTGIYDGALNLVSGAIASPLGSAPAPKTSLAAARLAGGDVALTWGALQSPPFGLALNRYSLAVVDDATGAVVTPGLSVASPLAFAPLTAPGITATGGEAVLGYASGSGAEALVVLRNTSAAGVTDTSFGTDGTATVAAAATFEPSDVTMATLANGNIVTVWREASTTMLSFAIHTPAGQFVTQRLNFDTFDNGRPSVAALPDGRFVVAYDDGGWGGPVRDITLAAFNADGSPAFLPNSVSGIFTRVTAAGSVPQANPDIAVHENGWFTLAWSSTASGFSTLRSQTFDQLGAMAGPSQFISLSRQVDGPVTTAALGDGRLALVYGNGNVDIEVSGQVWQFVRTVTASTFGERLNGYALADDITGGAGNDTLDGGAGNDTMIGSEGSDEYAVDGPGDLIIEAFDAGIDTVFSSAASYQLSARIEVGRLVGGGAALVAGVDTRTLVANQALLSTLTGSGFDDVLWGGGNFAHVLNGGAGNDIFRAQDSPAVMRGSTGNDQYVVGKLAAQIIENAGEGTDTLWLSINGCTNAPEVEIIYLGGGANQVDGSNTAEQIVANPSLASLLRGQGGNDVLWGGAGHDSLFGGEGDDILRGQGGDDQMTGGNGNDQYVAFTVNSLIFEAPGAGYDIVYLTGAGLMYVGAEVEEVRLLGAGTGIVGNGSANLLVGNNAGLASYLDGYLGDDTIFGTAAADTIIGGAGNDTMYSQGGADRFILDAPVTGYDQIAGFTQGMARLQFTAASGITSFGQLTLNSAGPNTQVEWNGNAVLLFGVAGMSAADFLFG